MINADDLNVMILSGLSDVFCVVYTNGGELIYPRDPVILEKYRALMENPTNITGTYYIKQTGEWYEKNTKYMSFNGRIYQFDYFRDITKYKEREQAMQRDYTTGIDNREATIFRINEYLMYALERNEEFSVMLADVDHFKEINDTYGHLFGDIVLKNVGELIHKNTRHGGNREEDIGGRFGGDEFFGLIKNVSFEESVGWVNRANEAVKALVHTSLDGQTSITDVRMSIGMYHITRNDIEEFNDSSLNIDQIRKIIFDRCDQSLYEVKRKHHAEEDKLKEEAHRMIH